MPYPFIAHIDVDAFFASILVRNDPRLKGKPLLALGMGGGCVIAASYEAKALGIKTGMRLSDARKLCPGAIERISNFAEACRASAHIEEILARQCPAMEKMSVDEWFLDLHTLVGGVPKDLGAWAQDIQSTIKTHLDLTVSVGIGPTKTLAKMASEYRKPAGVSIIPNSEFGIRNFLSDRPAAAVPGLGRKRMLHADEHGWKTAWDFANAQRSTVVHLFGRPGGELQQELLGTVIYPLEVNERPPQSISRCRSFRRTNHAMTMHAQLQEHMTVTVMRMRREHLSARNLSVWVRDHEYHHMASECRLPRPMDTEEELLPYARRALRQVWKPGNLYTQIGLTLSHLSPAGGNQYSLFEPPETSKQRRSIQEALDEIHNRFGRDAVVRGPAAGLSKKRKTRGKTMVGDWE